MRVLNEMPLLLTIKEAADYRKLSYSTVFQNRIRWGFFTMPGTRSWRISYDDLKALEQRPTSQCLQELAITPSLKNRGNKWLSTKEKILTGSILQRQAGKELDKALEQLKKH